MALCALGALVTPPPVEVQSPLVEKLLQRTAENRAINEESVRRITQQNAYLAVSGEPGMKRLVTGVNGDNIFLDEPTVARMTRKRPDSNDPNESCSSGCGVAAVSTRRLAWSDIGGWPVAELGLLAAASQGLLRVLLSVFCSAHLRAGVFRPGEGRIACGIGEPCRVVEPMGANARGGKPIGLPVPKDLSCDAQGRNCKFEELK